jgi:hypothetical protein
VWGVEFAGAGSGVWADGFKFKLKGFQLYMVSASAILTPCSLLVVFRTCFAAYFWWW